MRTFKYAQLDATSKGFSHERNDCVVRAISIATGLPYEDVHMEMFMRGRRDGRGMMLAKYEPFILKHSDHKLDTEFIAHLSVANLTKSFCRTGTWIIQQRGHLSVIKDGVQVDTYPTPRKRILNAWRIRNQSATV